MNSVATEQLWIDFGLDSAVFLDYVAHWLHLNSSNKQPRNFYEGRYWTYNTLNAMQSIFPGWSRDTIRGIIRKCVKNGLLIVSNFNKKKYDRTNWYTLSDLALQYYPKLSNLIQKIPDNLGGVSCGEITTWCGEITTPIPNNLTTSSNNTITTNVSDETSSSKISNQEVIDCYHEHLPELTRIKVIDRDLSNKINSMKKNWPKYQKDGKEFTINLFVDFLQFIKKHHSWFLKPRVTEGGNIRKNSLRNLIAEINLARFANGEFSAS